MERTRVAERDPCLTDRVVTHVFLVWWVHNSVRARTPGFAMVVPAETGIAGRSEPSHRSDDELDVARRRKTGAAGARDRTGCTDGAGPACTLPHAGSASRNTPLVDDTRLDRVDRGGISRRLFRGLASHEIPVWECPLGRSVSVAQQLGNAISGKLLQRWLVVVFAVLSTLWLLAWIPHYLYWPWCRDADSYALMAQEWDSGVLPYRDIRSFNFPGHMYLHWILGKLFGWGLTGLLYAFDATALLFLGAVVIMWSRRRLGLLLPGMTAYLIFLAYYLDISFMNVAQRDWHAPLCTTLGLLMLEAWPGRRTRWFSALLAAIAASRFDPMSCCFCPPFWSRPRPAT